MSHQKREICIWEHKFCKDLAFVFFIYCCITGIATVPVPMHFSWMNEWVNEWGASFSCWNVKAWAMNRMQCSGGRTTDSSLGTTNVIWAKCVFCWRLLPGTADSLLKVTFSLEIGTSLSWTNLKSAVCFICSGLVCVQLCWASIGEINPSWSEAHWFSESIILSVPHHSLVLNLTRTWFKQNSSKLIVSWWTLALFIQTCKIMESNF